MSALGTFFRLPQRERQVVLEAAWLLCAAAAGLRFGGFRRMREFGHGRDIPPTLPAARIALLFDAVARRTFARCLTRSVALRWLLARHGVASELRIGVRRSGVGLDAHAWVEHEGVVLNDSSEVRHAYAILDRDLPATAHWS